jgi:hypothetical protein
LNTKQVTNLNTGVTTYVQQVGVSSTGTAVYSTTSVYPVNTSYTCAGTLVTNSDGTKSCVTQVGTSVNGYPIYQVSIKNCHPCGLDLKFVKSKLKGHQLEHGHHQLR